MTQEYHAVLCTKMAENVQHAARPRRCYTSGGARMGPSHESRWPESVHNSVRVTPLGSTRPFPEPGWWARPRPGSQSHAAQWQRCYTFAVLASKWAGDRWRAEGRSLRWIASRLNGDGAKTQRNGKWHVSTVRSMLGNRFYTGRVEFEGELIRAQHDGIVSDVLFEEAAVRNGERQTGHGDAGTASRLDAASARLHTKNQAR